MEAWQTLGAMLGVFSIKEWVREIPWPSPVPESLSAAQRRGLAFGADRCRRDHQTQQRSATMKTRLRTYTDLPDVFTDLDPRAARTLAIRLIAAADTAERRTLETNYWESQR